jgi:S1-C subfamily serine protease
MQGSRKGRKERTGATAWTPAAGSGWGAPHPGQPGTPGLGWPPVSPGGSGDSGWGFAGGPGGTPPPALRRRGRALTAAAIAAVAAVATATGFGVGHEIWPTGSSVTTASQGGAALPNNTGSGSAQNPGSSSSGQSPFGSGDGSGSPFGQSPFGSGGSSGPSFGQSPFGQSPFGQSPSGQSPSGPGGSSGGSPGGSGAEGSGGPSDVGSIAAKVAPALVDVNSTFGYQSAQGAGTGVVLSSTGEILTNNHVIDGATKISVTDVGNGKTYTATVVGYDASHDIAVLQLQGASGLQTAKLGDSAKAAVGDAVVAIGNAGGTGGTPTSAGGSITAVGQSITASDELGGTSEQLSGMIQVNADVQAGDSGGSLVNSAGQVIGIDTAGSAGSSSQSAGNQGFAIPINQALTVANQIESGQGSATAHVGSTAFLGVQISSSGGQTGSGSYYGGGSASPGGPGTQGAAVGGVITGGAAQRAGLAAGDVITSLNGQTVSSAAALSGLMVGEHPGNQVTIGWTDTSGQSHTATVDLGAGPPA